MRHPDDVAPRTHSKCSTLPHSFTQPTNQPTLTIHAEYVCNSPVAYERLHQPVIAQSVEPNVLSTCSVMTTTLAFLPVGCPTRQQCNGRTSVNPLAAQQVSTPPLFARANWVHGWLSCSGSACCCPAYPWVYWSPKTLQRALSTVDIMMQPATPPQRETPCHVVAMHAWLGVVAFTAQPRKPATLPATAQARLTTTMCKASHRAQGACTQPHKEGQTAPRKSPGGALQRKPTHDLHLLSTGRAPKPAGTAQGRPGQPGPTP